MKRTTKPPARRAPRRSVDLTPIHTKRAAEFWSEIFIEALGVYAGDEGQIPPDVAAQRARALADAALTEFEDRWAGIRI